MLAMKPLLVLVPVFGLASAARAEALSYTYGEVGYARVSGETGDIDDEGDYGFNVSGRYHFTPVFSVGLAVGTDDNVDVFTTTASARLELR